MGIENIKYDNLAYKQTANYRILCHHREIITKVFIKPSSEHDADDIWTISKVNLSID